MSWLFGLIWLALLLCFIAGAIVMWLWWLWRRRDLIAGYEKRRLAGEAESDRLRLRVSSLKAAELRAEDLATDLQRVRGEAARLPLVDAEVRDLRTKVEAIPDLEHQILNLEIRAEEADALESRIAQLTVEANKVGELEAEIVDLRDDATRVGSLESEVIDLRLTAERVGELERRLETYDATAAKVEELEGRLSVANDAMRIKDEQLAARTATADDVENLRSELEAARRQVEAEAVRVGQLQDQLSATESDLGTARRQAEDAAEVGRQLLALRADNESLNAQLAHRDQRVVALEAELAERPAAAELESLRSEVETLRHELAERPEADRAAEASLVEARAEVAGMRMEIEAARAEVESTKNESGLHETALTAARSELASATEAKAELQRETKRLTSELTEATAELERANARSATDAEVANHLRAEVREAQAAAARVGDLEAELKAARAHAEQAALVPERDETIAKLEKRLAKSQRSLEKAKAKAKARSEEPEGRKDRKKSSKKKRTAGTAGWQDGTTKLGTPGANHRDDLKVIKGIGPVMERTLNGFGIQTWEQVAAFSSADIQTVTEAIETFPGRIERDDWVGGAQRLLDSGHEPSAPVAADSAKNSKSTKKKPAQKKSAQKKSTQKKSAKTKRATSTSGKSWQQGTTELGTAGAAHTDDLKVVNGIGPVMERTLNGFGITSWEQLAALTKAEVATVTEAIATFPGRIERDRWVAQAADLVKRFPLTEPYARPDRKSLLNKR